MSPDLYWVSLLGFLLIALPSFSSVRPSLDGYGLSFSLLFTELLPSCYRVVTEFGPSDKVGS